MENYINLIKDHNNILIFGDLIIDKYINIHSSRISSEDILPVMEYKSKKYFLGGAGNIMKNLAQFNCNITLFSILNKKYIEIFNKEIGEEDVNIDNIILDNNYNQIKKRYIRDNKQYFRIDKCDKFDYNTHKQKIENDFENYIKNNQVDLIIISDYNMGFCSNANKIINLAKNNGVKVFIDPHGEDLLKYKFCNYFKPNKNELQTLSKININDNDDILIASKKVIELIECDIIFVTLGKEGIFYYERNGNYNTIKPNNVGNFIDVCGAGDIVDCVLSKGIINNIDLNDLCLLANEYAYIGIQKIGTPKINFYDLISNKGTQIIELGKLDILLGYINKHTKINIGVTTGCFDIFHCGHFESLKFCKNNCDLFILFLNSDSSITKLKGETRPINNIKYRIKLLKQLNIADFIVVFDDKHANTLLDKIKFNTLFKGGDYSVPELEKQFPNVNIVLTPLINDISTSKIIENISTK